MTRDGRFVFIYAWHEESAQEAERVVKNLMQDEKLVGQVRLMRWHPVAEEWKDASEPLPDDEAARLQEMHEAEQEGSAEARRYGEFPWEVVIDLPHVRDGQALAKQLRDEGFHVKRHFRYLLVGAPSEDKAIEIGKRLEGEVPEGAQVGVRGNPTTCPSPPSSTWARSSPGSCGTSGSSPPGVRRASSQRARVAPHRAIEPKGLGMLLKSLRRRAGTALALSTALTLLLTGTAAAANIQVNSSADPADGSNSRFGKRSRTPKVTRRRIHRAPPAAETTRSPSMPPSSTRPSRLAAARC